jgi:hypothetical protein
VRREVESALSGTRERMPPAWEGKRSTSLSRCLSWFSR